MTSKTASDPQEHAIWPGYLDGAAALAPELSAAFLRLRSAAWDIGPLPAKTKELILLAVNASATHLHRPAMAFHLGRSRAAGASNDEILEVLELTSVIGIHTCTTGLPILMEELRAAGIPLDQALSPKQKSIKEDFVAQRGWWSDFLEEMLLLAPDLLEAYVEYSTVPWRRGAIPPKVKELIYIAIDAQTTHLYERGLRVHIQNALKLGAAPEEIVQVLALISGLGFHTIAAGAEMLNGSA